MKKIDVSLLNKEVHFPLILPLPSKETKGIFSKVKSFLFFRRFFEVQEDYICWCESLKQWIFLPKRFQFDAASVPKILNSLYQTTGMLLYGSGPHDFGYRYEVLIHVDEDTGELFIRNYSRWELDNIFKCLCEAESGLSKTSWIASFILKGVGYFPWRRYRKNTNVLKPIFPELFITE